MKEKNMTVGEFVRRATPLVAKKYGLRLDDAEKLVRREFQEAFEEKKLQETKNMN
jgi:hypothetical protein